MLKNEPISDLALKGITKYGTNFVRALVACHPEVWGVPRYAHHARLNHR